MEFDPVIQWGRIVAARNEQDWRACEALHADNYDEVVVTGSLYDAAPAMRFNKAEYLPVIKQTAEQRGWSVTTQSIAGQGDTVVTSFEETYNDRTPIQNFGIVRFNDKGQAREAYFAPSLE
jgi:hypothetical protein